MSSGLKTRGLNEGIPASQNTLSPRSSAEFKFLLLPESGFASTQPGISNIKLGCSNVRVMG